MLARGAPDGDALEALERDNEKLRKINAVLIDRVERSNDASGSSFALFQRSIVLEAMVRERTAELEAVNVALLDAQLEAERANLSKTKFLAAAGHDLLQPLHAARLFVSALRHAGDAESREIAKRIDSALADAEKLLSTTLEISKLDAGVLVAEIEEFHIGSLLRRLADESSVQAEERGLRFRVVTCDVFVRSDRQLLARLLRNLIGNAIRYTERGGVVLGCRLRGNVVRVEVWDTGAGIAPERIKAIFEEFRQFDVPGREREGMGLGLAIVERIARLLELPLAVKSTPGRGSVFSIDVPLGTYRADVSDEAHDVSASDFLAGKTAIVIDDDPHARGAMAHLLRAWNCIVIEASGTAAAVQAVRAHGNAPDFIIADFQLRHGETGLDAIETLRGRPFGYIPALVVTSDPSAETKAAVTACGYPLLAKPVRADRLRALANSWFARESATP